MILDHQNPGRSPLAILALIAWLGALLGARIALDLNLWILIVLLLAALPLLYDIVTNRTAGLRLDGQTLSWHLGPTRESLPLDSIDHIRFERRFDLSMRLTVVLRSGRRLRVPAPCLAPTQSLEEAFETANLRFEHHPFTLLS